MGEKFRTYPDLPTPKWPDDFELTGVDMSDETINVWLEEIAESLRTGEEQRITGKRCGNALVRVSVDDECGWIQFFVCRPYAIARYIEGEEPLDV